MVKVSVTYTGDLHCDAEHGPSQSKIITDAPTDNHGKGEAFSPTDLVATALASCMITVMGIAGMKEGMTKIDGAAAEVTKVMYQEPRRIGEIHITLTMPKHNFTEKEKQIY